jgi:hypothetical protein
MHSIAQAVLLGFFDESKVSTYFDYIFEAVGSQH